MDFVNDFDVAIFTQVFDEVVEGPPLSPYGGKALALFSDRGALMQLPQDPLHRPKQDKYKVVKEIPLNVKIKKIIGPFLWSHGLEAL